MNNQSFKYKLVKKLKEESTSGGNATFSSGTEGENYATPKAFKKPIKEEDVESFLKDTNVEEPDLKKWISSRLLGFDKIEEKLNELLPLLQQAKHKTKDYYRQTPDYSVVYGTDLAIDYLEDLITLFKD